MGFGGGGGGSSAAANVASDYQRVAQANAQNAATQQQAQEQAQVQAQAQQEQQMQMQMQQQEQAQFQQEQLQMQQQAAQNAATIASINAQYKSATQQTSAAQAASQLGIMDYIATSPEGIGNQQGTLGALKLLGN